MSETISLHPIKPTFSSLIEAATLKNRYYRGWSNFVKSANDNKGSKMKPEVDFYVEAVCFNFAVDDWFEKNDFPKPMQNDTR